jgi:enoyl-CoA hydratase/carnithine racemase
VNLDEIVSVRLAAGGASALWEVLTAVGRQLTGAVRVVVVRGEGADFFHDMASDPGPPPPGAVSWLRRPDLIAVAAIAGRATGAGLDVAFACDLRIAAADAELALTAGAAGTEGDGTGVEPGLETVARLGDLVGAARALELALTGRRVSGLEAATIGMVNQAVRHDQLDHAVDAVVAAVLRRPRASVTQTKALLAAPEADRRRHTDDLVAGVKLASGET